MVSGLRRRDRIVENTRPTLMTRLRGANARKRTVKTTTKIVPANTLQGHNHVQAHTHNTRASGTRLGRGRRTAKPVAQRRRRVSLGDKVSGAMMKLRGTLTNKPGVKVKF